MTRPSGVSPVSGRAFRAARETLRGLVTVLVGADPAPTWRSAWQRRAVHAGLTAATLAACGVSLGSVTNLNSPIRLDDVILGPLRPPKAWYVSVPRGVKQIVRAGQLHVNVRAVNAPPPFLHGSGGFGIGPGLLATPGGSIVIAVLVALGVVAPLPLAARYPLMGWRIGWLGLLLVPLAGVKWAGGLPWNPVQLVVVLVVFCVAGVRVRRAGLWWMWVLMLVAWWVRAAGGRPGVVSAVAGSVVVCAAAVAAGALGAWRGARQQLVSAAERTELEQARRAVLEERARIARELHDVVAHHMSLLAVRAETAPYRLAGLDEGVVAEFASLSGGARLALADMRRLLGVLRHEGPAALALAPQLADVPALIEGARRAGVGVVFCAGAAAGAVPPPVGVCAYRIVQESLSNASRHAPGAPVTVWLSHDHHAVELRVENGPANIHPAVRGHAALNENPVGGPATVTGNTMAAGNVAVDAPAVAKVHAATSAHGVVNGHAATDGHIAVDGLGARDELPPEPGSGHGLAGMRERVALLGGTLSAGPSLDGGFIVSAVLPLGEAA